MVPEQGVPPHRHAMPGGKVHEDVCALEVEGVRVRAQHIPFQRVFVDHDPAFPSDELAVVRIVECAGQGAGTADPDRATEPHAPSPGESVERLMMICLR